MLVDYQTTFDLMKFLDDSRYLLLQKLNPNVPFCCHVPFFSACLLMWSI
jgi:hypothetical protein